MHKPQQQVRDWHQDMGDRFPPPGASPIDITRNRSLRIKLIAEEFEELEDAVYANQTISTIDALCDLLFVIYGTADTWGIDLEPFFDEVVRSNRTKIGGPIRADGKRLKPETYEPPRLAEILNAQ